MGKKPRRVSVPPRFPAVKTRQLDDQSKKGPGPGPGADGPTAEGTEGTEGTEGGLPRAQPDTHILVFSLSP